MTINRKEFLLSLLLTITVSLSGCDTANNGTGDPKPDPDTYLVSSSEVASLTKTQLAAQIGQQFPAQYQAVVLSFLKYDVKVYKLVYNTKLADGTATKASGAILVPTITTAVPMVSQQHGTILSDTDAPSNFGPNSEAAFGGTLFASIGFIMVCPDYIGYGESKAIPHTYEYRESLATASLDMIRAAKEFVKAKSIKWDNRLFLSGYSEGGFATMSLQKKIEEEFPTEFTLAASSMGAGAYHKSAFMNYIINQKTHGISGYNQLYLWTLITYNNLYKLNKPMSYYLKEPYATQATQNGYNIPINTSISNIFTDSFKKAVNDGTDTGFLNAIKDNDVHDWKPKTPTYLYHGTADNLVFFFNTQDAYDAMRKRGATNVEIKPLDGKDHSTAIIDYLLGTYFFFTSVH
ncbi:alpha/beta hydrolase family protein [Larkinella terrae]|uniref:Phospholipase n=1 Tax=Larkinella terrae TaxID=2025311 RepID=A0A7K0ERY9_9BACT|nr:lipase family protein [Larkinella terrae]MRS64306.1 phospholipase [Larkinella terrae]